jgi:hypothetical protein
MEICGINKKDFADAAELAFPDESKPTTKTTTKKGAKK